MSSLIIKRDGKILAHTISNEKWLVLDPSPAPGPIILQLFQGTGNDCDIPASIIGRVGDLLIIEIGNYPQFIFWASLDTDDVDSVWIIPELPSFSQYKINANQSQEQNP